MSEKNRQAHRGEPGTLGGKASYTAAAASSIDTTSATQSRNEQTPHQPTKLRRDNSPPTPTLEKLSMRAWRILCNPRLQHQRRSRRPASRHDETDEGWKKVERKRKGRGREKKGWNGQKNGLLLALSKATPFSIAQSSAASTSFLANWKHIIQFDYLTTIVICLNLKLSLVISFGRLFPVLHYLGEWVAATEPDLRGGTADRKRKNSVPP